MINIQKVKDIYLMNKDGIVMLFDFVTIADESFESFLTLYHRGKQVASVFDPSMSEVLEEMDKAGVKVVIGAEAKALKESK